MENNKYNLKTMKKKLKKVNNKQESYKEESVREEAESKEKLAEFIKINPGATLNDLYDNWTGLDGYDFLKCVLTLFDEYKVIEDIGCYFPDEATRLRMCKEGLY